MIMIIIVNLQYKNNVVASILFGTHGLQEHSGWDYSLFDGSFPHLFSSVVLAMSSLWGKTVSHHGKLSQFLTPILITTAADLLLPPPFDPPRPAQGSTARLKKQNNTKGKNKKRLKKQTEKIPDLSPVQLTVSNPNRQGGHFQTHSDGHFQTQSSFESIFTARDIILGPKISKHTWGVIFKHKDETRRSFSNTNVFFDGRLGQHFHDVHKAFFHMKIMWYHLNPVGYQRGDCGFIKRPCPKTYWSTHGFKKRDI